jgi:hypothetical protein
MSVLPSKLIDTKKRKKRRAPRFKLSTWLVGYTIDNIVFRHEIRMSTFNQLRPTSPVIQTHFIMAALLVVHGLIAYLTGLEGLLAGSMALLALLALATYPLMLKRACHNLRTEYRSGAWDQLALTSLTHREVFEGKYYGLLSPVFELRRYLNIFTLIVVGSGSWLARDWHLIPLLLAYCMVMRNQIDAGARFGVLGGFDGAAKRKGLAQMLLLNMEYNPFVPHLMISLKYLLHVLLPLLVGMVALAFLWDPMASKIVFAIMSCALLYIPLMAAHDLRNREAKLREAMMRSFKHLFRGKRLPWNVI